MMENREIQNLLPHRYPFLLVDRLIALEPGKRAVGVKNLTGGEWHSPGLAAYPPALLLESLAQVGGLVLASQVRGEDPEAKFKGLFAGVSNFHFLRPARWGEQVQLKAELAQSLASVYRFAAEASVGEETIARGQILLSLLRRPAGK